MGRTVCFGLLVGITVYVYSVCIYGCMDFVETLLGLVKTNVEGPGLCGEYFVCC